MTTVNGMHQSTQLELWERREASAAVSHGRANVGRKPVELWHSGQAGMATKLTSAILRTLDCYNSPTWT